MTTTTTRPSISLYCREGDWAEVMEDIEGPYSFGYVMGARDAKAGLPALTWEEMSNLWHSDYSEGYDDGYGDFASGL
jgi:hypothetical protein